MTIIRNKILLVESPNQKAWDIPFGSLPALTAHLRNHGYNVDQYDLSNEVLLKLLDKEIFDELIYLLEKKTKKIESHVKSRKKGFISTLKRKILKNKILLGFVQWFYFNFISHRINEKDKPYSVLWFLQNSLRKLSNIQKYHNGLKDEWLKNIENNTFDTNLFRKLLRANRFMNEAIVNLTFPLKKDRNFFDRFEDEEFNYYYKLYDDFEKRIKWDEVLLIGITATPMSKIPALILARLIKKKHPEIKIVLGGMLTHEYDPENPYDKDDYVKLLKDFADYTVKGEGETALLGIVEYLTGKKSIESIPNVIYLKDEQLIVNQPYYLEKLDDLFDFDFEGLPVKYYSGLPVEVSRGCYWGKCAFCRYFQVHSESKNYINSPIYRKYPVDKIIKRVMDLQEKYNTKNFEFVCLDISPKQAYELCHAIIDNKLKIRWNARIRLDKTFKPDLFHLLKKSGATMCMMYPETFSKNVAKLHNKNYDIDHIKSLILYWKEHKEELIPVVVKIMAGFPGETYKDFKDTIKFIEKHNIMIQNIGFFNVAKGCEVYQNPSKYGLEIIPEKNPDDIFQNYRVNWDDKLWRERYKIENWVINKRNRWSKYRTGWNKKYEVFLSEDE